MAIRNRTKDVIDQRGIKVKALATEAGLAYNTVYNFIYGHTRRIDLRTLDRLCRALEVQPGELLAYGEQSGPQEP